MCSVKEKRGRTNSWSCSWTVKFGKAQLLVRRPRTGVTWPPWKCKPAAYSASPTWPRKRFHTLRDTAVWYLSTSQPELRSTSIHVLLALYLAFRFPAPFIKHRTNNDFNKVTTRSVLPQHDPLIDEAENECRLKDRDAYNFMNKEINRTKQSMNRLNNLSIQNSMRTWLIDVIINWKL